MRNPISLKTVEI